MRQELLEELLRKKGIGPKGSKSLGSHEVSELKLLLPADEVSLTTKATILTALLTLEPNDDEAAFIEEVKANPEQYLPIELIPFIKTFAASEFLSIINKVIAREDLSEEEAFRAMDFFFDHDQPEFLKAAFLEAERLKRETFTENKIFFQSLWNRAERRDIDLPYLIHICDSYDGSNRTRNYSPFTACLLGASGYPCLITGVESVAPKQGVTAHQILKTADKNPLTSMEKAKEELKEKGWSYLDQQVFFPKLSALTEMRKEMVKRPFLATFEKLLQPVKASKNYIVTGFTHTHYREELVKQLKEQKECEQAIVLKGMEGGTHLSMTRDTICVHLKNLQEIEDTTVSPAQFGLPDLEEKQDKSITADVSFQEGLAALKGEDNYARKSILYQAAVIINKFGFATPEEAVTKLTEVLDSGKAFSNWSKS